MRNDKQTTRQLKRLLSALLRDQAVLLCEQELAGETSIFGVYVEEQGHPRLILRPGRHLVEHCIAEDLLIKNKAGWSIASNGRHALKRMLAGADPFAEQHQQRKVHQRKINDVHQEVVLNDRSTPLGWLSRRTDARGAPMISKTQFAAGERLAQDFQYAGLVSRMTSSWSDGETGGQKRRTPGTGVLVSDNRLAAQQRVRQAMKEMGNDLASILLDICCFQLGLSEAEKTRGWPRRSGKIILRIALDQLADYYGMNSRKNVRRNSNKSTISHWGTQDYKPS